MKPSQGVRFARESRRENFRGFFLLRVHRVSKPAKSALGKVFCEKCGWSQAVEVSDEAVWEMLAQEHEDLEHGGFQLRWVDVNEWEN